jgi:hypothetical protein
MSFCGLCRRSASAQCFHTQIMLPRTLLAIPVLNSICSYGTKYFTRMVVINSLTIFAFRSFLLFMFSFPFLVLVCFSKSVNYYDSFTISAIFFHSMTHYVTHSMTLLRMLLHQIIKYSTCYYVFCNFFPMMMMMPFFILDD